MSSWVVPGYAEERELGSGASGRVVAAVHAASGTRVAIKYLSPRLFADPGFLAAFRGEAQLLRSLADPHVVRLLDYAEAPGQGAAIVMELVSGVSLHEMITRQGPTSLESALVVLKGSLLGLAAAHALGIVHRDYKPENVLVDPQGKSKLTDFGVATRQGQNAPTGGTPLYMAPEQWDGTPATPATDIYAATVVFFECLTGMTPFSGGHAQLAAQHAAAAVPVQLIDEPLRALITRGMAKDPAARPASATALVTELETTAAAAYGQDWESRGHAQLAGRAAALLLLLLQHGSAAAVASGTGSSSVTTTLAPKAGLLSHVSLPTAIIGAGVAVTVAVAAAVIIGRPAGHTPPAPVQRTGTQLASALLPVSDFPGYRDDNGAGNSGSSLDTQPVGDSLTKANCAPGQSSIFTPGIGFLGDFGGPGNTAFAYNSFTAQNANSISFIDEIVYQFGSPAEAVAFLSGVHACLTEEESSNGGVGTAPVDGNQAVTATLRTPNASVGFYDVSKFLFVLHGTDVVDLSASAVQELSQITLPRATELIAELIARVDALGGSRSH